ncbi:hypothetical protein HYH03_002496 [Edaphochlamys debaryana]|uniref:FHA domain-containing protein n=1 Tax=Edaphochlamys debaryana TaxID=47281 RepID=A0A835YER2_9CHLO|nr:hypothetical protein HYH03_002496 [Edaphochlamys debaryana]|eukprot:KAG2499551.1 hypothetical protein HYH03_002496 [Edaphochlamys debaryana]
MAEGAGPSIAPNDPRLSRCGFAKLSGPGIEFFMRKYEITVGRNSKNSTLDLALGESTTLSRQHATIRYNFDTKCFELVVLGKNGVTVESAGTGASHLYTPDSRPTQLNSRDLLIMGEKRFHFLLPRSQGGGARKRRRVEPSPAPQSVGVSTGVSAGVSAGGPVAVPAAAPAGPHPSAAPAPSGPPGGVPVANLAPAYPTNVPTPAAAPVVASAPAAVAAAAAPLPQAVPAPAPVVQQPPAVAAAAPAAAPAAAVPAADDEDALITAGPGLSYDNGAPYGYDGGNNGFAGAF